jgi:hypothetical protein
MSLPGTIRYNKTLMPSDEKWRNLADIKDILQSIVTSRVVIQGCLNDIDHDIATLRDYIEKL